MDQGPGWMHVRASEWNQSSAIRRERLSAQVESSLTDLLFKAAVCLLLDSESGSTRESAALLSGITSFRTTLLASAWLTKVFRRSFRVISSGSITCQDPGLERASIPISWWAGP